MGLARSVWAFGKPLLRIASLFVSLLNPIGWVRLAMMGVIYAFARFTGAGSQLLSWVSGFGEKIKSIFTSAFGDVAEMIQEGRILDAVKLMWLKIQLYFEEGKLALMNKWDEVAAAISEPFMAIYDAIAEVVRPAVEFLVEVFDGLGIWMEDQFGVPMRRLWDFFGDLWTYIGEGWDALMNDLGYVIVGTWWSIATKINESLAWIRTQWNNLITGIQTTLLGFLRSLAEKVNTAASWLDPTGYITSATSSAISEIDRMIAEIEQRGIDVNADIETGKQERQAALDDMAMESLKKVDAVKNAPKTNDRIEGIKREIAELKKPVSEPNKRAREITDTAQRLAQSGASSIVSGTMNKQDILGGALAFMASEKDHSEDIADNTGTMVDQLKETNSILRRGGGLVLA